MSKCAMGQPIDSQIWLRFITEAILLDWEAKHGVVVKLVFSNGAS